MSFLTKLAAKARSVFTTLKNRVTGIFKKKATRRRSKKYTTAYTRPSVAAPAAEPLPTPAVPVQAAGKKMRAKNMRGMKFYKPKKATRRRR
jgi:hypothetical protein